MLREQGLPIPKVSRPAGLPGVRPPQSGIGRERLEYLPQSAACGFIRQPRVGVERLVRFGEVERGPGHDERFRREQRLAQRRLREARPPPAGANWTSGK